MDTLSGFGVAFVAINIVLVLLLPRRLATIPFLICACYIALKVGVAIGPFNFFSVRLLILSGLIRVFLRWEIPHNGLNGLDKLMLLWATFAILSGMFYPDPAAALKGRLGLVFDSGGIYFLLRCFLRSAQDVVNISRFSLLLLVPVALEMISENLTTHNMFSILGGVYENSEIRDGRVRAQGPFRHSILAGTVGAVCLPLAIGLWAKYRKTAILGVLTCFAMIVASSSSGPAMSGLFSLMAVLLWRYRHLTRIFLSLSILSYIALELVMNRPAYYIITLFNVTGASATWHRARLIESAFEHIGEWWLRGTDYTRHWMPTGVYFDENHTDITSHYLQMGVTGGIPLMLTFIATVVLGFVYVGRLLKIIPYSSQWLFFFVWTLGASLFAHAATCISVSYFDQSLLFFYLTLASISSLYSYYTNEVDSPNPTKPEP